MAELFLKYFSRKDLTGEKTSFQRIFFQRPRYGGTQTAKFLAGIISADTHLSLGRNSQVRGMSPYKPAELLLVTGIHCFSGGFWVTLNPFFE
ncbi:MAG: hypothetical protein WCW35_04995 [Bacteroidota bacterium]